MAGLGGLVRADDETEFDESEAFLDSIAARVDACASVLAEIKSATDPLTSRPQG